MAKKTSFFKSLFSGIKNRLRSVNPEMVQKVEIPNPYKDDIAEALVKAQKEVIAKRQKEWVKKTHNLGELYNARLNQYLSVYFATYSDDVDANKIAFDTYGQAWRKYALESNTMQDRVRLEPSAFEDNISRIIASKDFKQQLEKFRKSK